MTLPPLRLKRMDKLTATSLCWLTKNFRLRFFPRHGLQHKTLGTKWDDVSNWTSTGSAASGSCFSPSTAYKIKNADFFFLSLTLPPLRLKCMDKLTATSLCWLTKNFRLRFFPRHGLQRPTLGSTWHDVNSWTSTCSAESGSCFSPSMACKKKANFFIFLFLISPWDESSKPPLSRKQSQAQVLSQAPPAAQNSTRRLIVVRT